MNTDERLEYEQDINLTVGHPKKEVTRTALQLILQQWKQNDDWNQLIEDLDTLGIRVVEIRGQTQVVG